MADDSNIEVTDDFEILFDSEIHGTISITAIANTLPKKSEHQTSDRLPSINERSKINGVEGFYDFFQIMFVREELTAIAGFPDKAGWYWLTYFEPIGCGYGFIGPFTSEEETIEDACSISLPAHDPRRTNYPSGFIGDESKIAFSIPTNWKHDKGDS